MEVNTSRTDEYIALREKGLTHREIASVCGVSKQAVSQAIARRGGAFRPVGGDRVIYDGLRNWMNENRITVSELIRQYYGKNHVGGCRARMLNVLRGVGINKKDIDFFRNITGLSYEELFCDQCSYGERRDTDG